MRNALTIAFMEIRLVATDRMSVFWLLLFPFIMIFFFAKAMPQGADPSTRNVFLEVINHDDGFLSKAFLKDLEERGFAIHYTEPGKPGGRNGWYRTLVIPKFFTENVLQGRKTALVFESSGRQHMGAMEAARIKIYKVTGKLIGNLCLLEKDAAALDGEALAREYHRIAALEPRVALESTFMGKGRVIPGGYNQTVPGMIVMSILFTVMTYGTAMLAEDRRGGLLKRLAVTPTSRAQIITGKLLGRIFIGFIQVAILLLVSHLAFGFYLGNSVLGWILCMVPYAFACGALGMFMGCFFKSEDQAATLGWIPAIFMAALGGCWWPREVVSEYINAVGYIFPTAWAMDGLHKIISFGGDALSVLPQAAALTGFFALFMILSVRFIRFD